MSEDKTLGQMIGEATHVWRALLDRRLKPLGLSEARWRVLLHVSHAGRPLTQSELAARLSIGGPGLVSLLDRMEAAGWIERRPHETDRRRNMVHLAPRAVEAMAAIEAEARRTYADLTEGISAADMAAARRVLGHIRSRADALEESACTDKTESAE